MTLSMTGFSSTTLTIYPEDHHKTTENQTEASTQETQPVHITLNLKTLNSRFFESHFKLPNSLSHLETTLYKYLKKNLYRGNLYFSLHMSNPQALNTHIAPALSVVAEYLNSLATIKEKFNLQDNISLRDIISLPHIFQTQDTPIPQKTIDQITQAVHELVQTLTESRKQEGEALEKDILQRMALIQEYIEKLKPRAQKVMEQKKQQLQEHLDLLKECSAEVSSTITDNSNILSQLDKSDIHEEIVRFESHINNFLETLKSEKIEKGKKLDFILQELFREINTIGSKSADSTISSFAINIKVELEKTREQTQNIV